MFCLGEYNAFSKTPVNIKGFMFSWLSQPLSSHVCCIKFCLGIFLYLLQLFCISPTQTRNIELLFPCHSANPNMWHLYVCNSLLRWIGFVMFIITLKENWEETMLVQDCTVSLTSSHCPKLHVCGGSAGFLQQHSMCTRSVQSVTGLGLEYNWRKREQRIWAYGLSDRSSLIWAVGKNW